MFNHTDSLFYRPQEDRVAVSLPKQPYVAAVGQLLAAIPGSEVDYDYFGYARTFTVPVVVSITLSTVDTTPSAILWLSLRSFAVTASCAPAFIRGRICVSQSSGTVKITLIGSIWVITTSPVLLLVCT